MDESTGAESAPHIVVPSFVAPDFSKFGVSVDPAGIATVVFGVVFVWWALHTLFALYHWIRYGRTSWFAVPVVVGYLYGSANLIFYITSSLR